MAIHLPKRVSSALRAASYRRSRLASLSTKVALTAGLVGQVIVSVLLVLGARVWMRGIDAVGPVGTVVVAAGVAVVLVLAVVVVVVGRCVKVREDARVKLGMGVDEEAVAGDGLLGPRLESDWNDLSLASLDNFKLTVSLDSVARFPSCEASLLLVGSSIQEPAWSARWPHTASMMNLIASSLDSCRYSDSTDSTRLAVESSSRLEENSSPQEFSSWTEPE